MRDSLLLEMLNDHAHRRIVAECAILLVEAKVRGVQVDDKGRRFIAELPENILGGSYYNSISTATK